MRKLFVVAVLSLAAFGMGVAPASAGWFCHKCGKLGACATQFNAFSPYCVTGVYTSSHCHRCMHPAEGPCCGAGGGWGLNADGCGFGCGNTFSTGPASTAGVGSTVLGELPPVMTGSVPNGQMLVPQAPAPVPAIPGAMAPSVMPTHNIQPLGYQPAMPAPSAPYYWNN
jgi:hypothetical protein